MTRPSPLTQPRGPLPPQVYWFRRGLVVGVALLLVGGLVALVGSFGGGSSASGGDQAVTAAAPASPTASGQAAPTATASATAGATASGSATPTSGAGRRATRALSTSTGTCDPADVTVAATATKVVGGSAVAIPLQLTTSSDSCTLAVSDSSLVAKITSGKDRIWSSQDCPAAVPTSSVTVRPPDEKATTVDLAWSGRRSGEGCRGGTAWARTGTYHLVTATYGGEQSDQQFALVAPARPVVTKTAKPRRTQPSGASTPKG